MQLLEEKIKTEGQIYPNDVLKVDRFVNHQIDVKFIKELAKEIKDRFHDEPVTKILTIEASGIAIAFACAEEYDDCNVVFAKKSASSNMSKDVYTSSLYSYTRQQEFKISVAKEYLNETDSVLIVDDFLANGQAMNALLDVCKQAKCHVVGCTALISKAYQDGEKIISNQGVHLEVLARIKKMSDGDIEFY